MQPTTAAVAKATGGAGATRTCLEVAATLARAGHSVALLDADVAVQGLAARVDGRLDPDVTSVLADDAEFADALVELSLELDGHVAACPVRAPFERLARAQTTAAARTFEELIGRADELFDYVLVDAPPVATNLAVAAVTSVERVAAVAPASERGVDAVQRLEARLQDVGAAPGLTIANRTDGDHPLEDADAELPRHDVPRSAVPSCAAPDEAYAPAVADATETLFGVDLELSFEADGLLAGRFG